MLQPSLEALRSRVEALLAFAAALVALRLAGRVARPLARPPRAGAARVERGAASRTPSPQRRSRGAPRTAGTRARSVSITSSAGCSPRRCSAPARCCIWRRRWAGPVALVYAGLAVGIAIAVPVHGVFSGSDIPAAQDHLEFVPARLVAVAGNTLGTACGRRRRGGDVSAPAARQRADRPRRGDRGRRNRACRTRRGRNGRLRSGSGSRPVRGLCCAFALIFATICT